MHMKFQIILLGTSLLASAKKPQRPYWHGWQSRDVVQWASAGFFPFDYMRPVEQAMKDGMAHAIIVEIIGLRFSIGSEIWRKEDDGACVISFHSADSGNW